jgi:hypothetical protein
VGADQPGHRERAMILRVRSQSMVRIAAATAVFACSLTTPATAQEKTVPLWEARTATVRIMALCGHDFDFRRCNLKLSNFRRGGDATNLAGRFNFGSGSGIPYGTYEAAGYFADAWPALQISLGTVDVSQPDVLVVVDLRPLPPGSPRAKLPSLKTSNR